MLISVLDTYFVEASFNVELGEDECVLYFCDQFRDEGKWVSVADCPFVNTPIVLYRSL